MKVIPLTLKQANELVSKLHRHHRPVQGHRFSIGLMDEDKLVGAAIVGRPVSRSFDHYLCAEVTRLVTDGTANACSMLYGRCARIAKEMGFERIQTYILEEETGVSLKAAGWINEGEAGGHKWCHYEGKPRVNDNIGKKWRWAKSLI